MVKGDHGMADNVYEVRVTARPTGGQDDPVSVSIETSIETFSHTEVTQWPTEVVEAIKTSVTQCDLRLRRPDRKDHAKTTNP